jgi:adenylate kinase family enzyme
MALQKIAIIGITGSGKSYLGRRVAKKTGLPLFHLDTIYWRGKWQEVSEDEYLKEHEKILKENDRWVIEGWLNEKMHGRLHAADVIIYLDYPGWLVIWRYYKRWFKHRKIARPELPAESRERFRLKWLILGFLRNERPFIERALKEVSDREKIIRVRSPQEMEKRLSEVGLIADVEREK